jgi:DNA-binding NtrC family response regulator
MVGESRPAVARNTLAAPETVKCGIDCVVLTCFDSDFGLWAPVFRPCGIRLHRAQTLETADFLLTVTDATVLLTDLVFLDGSWVDAIGMLARFHPLVASLVMAEAVDRPFVLDAINGSAFGVLWKPIQLGILSRSIRFANEAYEERALWRRNLASIAV